MKIHNLFSNVVSIILKVVNKSVTQLASVISSECILPKEDRLD